MSFINVIYMKDICQIKDILKELITKDLSENPTDIKTLPASGSSRIYFRLFTDRSTYIATYSPNVEENKAFFGFTKHFEENDLPVPKILSINPDNTCYIQSDFGDISLFDLVQDCVKDSYFDKNTINLYKEALDNLVDFQIKGNENIDYSIAFPTPVFDRQSIIDDLNYFKYYFLKLNDEIIFNETRLNNDFQVLTDFIMQAPNDFFMYRDFQSRNIMIKDNHTYFIDYQGGRKGPLQYDIVSLLYQVKAQLPQSLRDELLSHYKERLSSIIDIKKIHFDDYYQSFVLLRLMQVLGAYGYRGLIQKKQHFLSSIPYALKEISSLNETLDLPLEVKELKSVLSQIKTLVKKYECSDSTTLTVTINSFSYKNGGIPSDMSGNGGGFVFDCRALPNPGRYQEYKNLTGLDNEVQEFIESKKECHYFFRATEDIVCQSIDNYIERHFNNLSVNFGCTGGQHRSVFFAHKMAEILYKKYPMIKIIENHIVQHKNFIYDAR